MIQQGQVINQTYEVIRPIGEGAAGLVYLGWHRNLQKNVIIKKIKEKYVGKINERREADVLKRLHHQYLPQVYDYIQDGTDVYTIIDYIDGNTLTDYIKQGAQIDEPTVRTWLHQMLEALVYLHAQKPTVIHCDIKPSNIMVDKEGNAHLIDFNVSFGDYEDRESVGYSEGFASPEQIYRIQLYSSGGNYQDVHLDERSDQFSLAASFYSLMTGINPSKKLRSNEPLFDETLPYSKHLIAILERALSIDPTNRYPDAAAMLHDLDTIYQRETKYVARKRAKFALKLLAAALVVFAAVGTWFGIRNARRQSFLQKYTTLAENTAADSSEVFSEAQAILNEEKYKDAQETYPEETADLYYMMANSCFEEERYADAVNLYAQATEHSAANPDFFRDYAIAAARNDQLDLAKEVVINAGEYQIEYADLTLIEAEIALKETNYETATEKFAEAIRATEKEDLAARAYILSGRAYREMGDDAAAVNILKEAESRVGEAYQGRVTRELGTTLITILGHTAEADLRAQYAQEAERVYTVLTQNEATATLRDWLNLINLKEMNQAYAEAAGILQKLANKYDDEYRIPMHQALVEINLQQEKSNEARNFATANQYYEQAEQLYKECEIAGESDPLMQNLRQTMQELKEKGWL